jgi:hypothetical protein
MKTLILNGSPTTQKTTQEISKMDMNSLAHTKWECKYHIGFAPKFSRKVIYGKIRADEGNVLSMLCKRKGMRISNINTGKEIFGIR